MAMDAGAWKRRTKKRGSGGLPVICRYPRRCKTEQPEARASRQTWTCKDIEGQQATKDPSSERLEKSLRSKIPRQIWKRWLMNNGGVRFRDARDSRSEVDAAEDSSHVPLQGQSTSSGLTGARPAIGQATQQPNGQCH